ncbi:MAG: dockerin type I domain-containing protein [Thermostichales cyanobacterium SZTDM-1c_bins_54]
MRVGERIWGSRIRYNKTEPGWEGTMLMGKLAGMVGVAWLSATAVLAQELSPPLGDLNGDGRVDGADAALLRDYLAGRALLTEAQIRAADLDQDGRVTTADLQWLERGSQQVYVFPQQEGVGRVVDRATGQPLANVEIAIPGAGIRVRSDAQGRFQLPPNVPRNQILVAKLENYLPFSQTTDGELSLNVQLDRWDQSKTLVLQSDVVHLGDDRYSPESAGADQFRLRTQGIELVRTFSLDRLPSRDPVLRIGSLIGLDTAAAVRAGQSRIQGADMSPLRVFFNGTPVAAIELGGNDIRIPLPKELAQIGTNTVTLRTGEARMYSGQSGVVLPFLGGMIQFGIPMPGSGSVVVDYDDIELANVTLELP